MGRKLPELHHAGRSVPSAEGHLHHTCTGRGQQPELSPDAGLCEVAASSLCSGTRLPLNFIPKESPAFHMTFTVGASHF